MTIEVKCACGKTLKAPETVAGKRVRCPACNGIVRIPAPVEAPEPAGLDLAEPQAPRARPPTGPMLMGGAAPREGATKPAGAPGLKPWERAVGIVLLVLLVFGLALHFWPGRESDALQYIPANCQLLCAFDGKAFRRIPGIKDGFERMEKKAPWDDLSKFGFTPKNVRSVHIATRRREGRDPMPCGLAIINTWKPVALDDAAAVLKKQRGNMSVMTLTEQGHTLHRITGLANIEVDMVLLEPCVLAVGSEEMVEECLKLTKGEGETVRENAGLMALCKNGRQKDMFWLVMKASPRKSPADTRLKGVVGPKVAVQPQPGGIAEMTLTGNYDRALLIKGQLVCRDEATADAIGRQWHLTMRGAMMNPFSGMKAKDMQVLPNGKVVTIDLRIPSTVLSSALKPRRSPGFPLLGR